MEDYFVNKATRKGLFKARVAVLADDVEYTIKLYGGGLPFPSGSHIKRMIERYDAEVFREKKFKHVGVYRSVLEIMAEEGELPEIDISDLRKVRVELLRYFHHVKGG